VSLMRSELKFLANTISRFSNFGEGCCWLAEGPGRRCKTHIDPKRRTPAGVVEKLQTGCGPEHGLILAIFHRVTPGWRIIPTVGHLLIG
jgi:hypothetical protein